jgi:outer membrane autotransporter protein
LLPITITAASGDIAIPTTLVLYNFGSGADLTIDGAHNTSISGVISEGALPVGVVKNGSGMLTLGGANTFTGGLDIQNGTVLANNSGAAGPSGSAITLGDTGGSNNATLLAGNGVTVANAINLGTTAGALTIGNYGSNAVVTFSGAIGLNGNNLTIYSFSNGGASTTISGGITGTGNLTLQSGGASSDTASVIISGASVNNSGTITNSGGGTGSTMISAVIGPNVTGVIQNSATSSLILSGINTYTSDTNINAGVLQVDGSIASLNTFVNPGGTLAGTGTIGGSVNNSGVVSPGDSPGKLTINSGYTQNSNGTLHIEIGGLTPGVNSDLLAVNGVASLSGTLQLVRINSFSPSAGNQVIILTAGSGLNNTTFDTVQSDFTGMVIAKVVYDPNDVRIVFVLSSFVTPGLTPNQKAVAQNLNSAANDPAAAPLINFLAGEPMANLPHDFDLIAPEELASIYEIGFSQAVVQNDNLQRRMDDIRAGSNGFCADGFVPQVSGKDYTKESDGKVSLPDKSTRDVYTPAPDNRWGVFVTGTGDFVNVNNNDSNAPGYDITTGDVTVGADYRLCDNFAIGIDAGYSRSTADLVDDGRVDVDGGKVGAYATVFGKGLFGSKFYVDGAVGGGFNSYDTRRTGLQDELVRGNTNGNEFNAMISYGSDWTFGCFNIGTWSTVQYTNVSIDQFTETGSLAPLIIEDQAENSFRATTGLHASYDIKAGHFIFRPEVRAAYQHEYCDQAYQVDSQLASGAGTVFRVRGPDIGRDAALVGTGMSMQWNNRLSTYVYYDGVLGRNNYDNNAVSGGFRIGF